MKFSFTSSTLLAAISLSTTHAFSVTPAFQPRTTPRAHKSTLYSTETDAAVPNYADASRYTTPHPSNNVPPHIAALVGRGLHTQANHP
eukprot:CAMPEP_0194378244 /NCGR_PEP_ID=MMETSP0174-20130528/34469_1 /TAXON_ID=216777 /ORGANISM="Proboscia alata, Strain PI-D3" /LENGTH=87 /DNA_ID=CAMNT_0039160099 /DNA_START=31 /DNA_END=290 /DNA_ORIENTATION=-